MLRRQCLTNVTNSFMFIRNRDLFFLMSWCVWARAGLATLLTGDKGVLERIKCSIATLHNCVLGAPGQRILDDIFNQNFQLAVGAKSTDMSNTVCWRSFFYVFCIVDDPFSKKTRCNPRTRMQSRKTLLWNKLFEQFCTFFPCYGTSALSTVECGMGWNAKCGVWRKWSVEWGM